MPDWAHLVSFNQFGPIIDRLLHVIDPFIPIGPDWATLSYFNPFESIIDRFLHVIGPLIPIGPI